MNVWLLAAAFHKGANNLEIRCLRGQDDLTPAFAVRDEVFIKEQGVAKEIELDAYDAHAEHVVICEEGRPVAAGRLRAMGEKAKLERICVIVSLRKRGLGEAVVEALEELARKGGMRTARLNAQVQAETFYEKMGYRRVSGEFMEANILHVTMEKALNKNDEELGVRGDR